MPESRMPWLRMSQMFKKRGGEGMQNGDGKEYCAD